MDTPFRPFSLKIRVETPEDAELFLAGLIVAQTNNASPLWSEMIDGVNAAMFKYRQAILGNEIE
jgi:hypothetical protein